MGAGRAGRNLQPAGDVGLDRVVLGFDVLRQSKDEERR